jgi:hypothetical protein
MPSKSYGRWSVEETDALLKWFSNPVNLDSYENGGKAEACSAIAEVIGSKTAEQVKDKLAAGSATGTSNQTATDLLKR